MPDREKVIKAIETHISTDDSVGCDDCTYENDGWCMTRVMTDALSLLKEQPEIIRCISCAFYRYDGECALHHGRWKPEGFCSWAISKKDR